jgi:hypothetical protein
VQRAELGPGDAPVQLLAEQRQVDELDEHVLQLTADIGTLVGAEAGEVGLIANRWHWILLVGNGPDRSGRRRLLSSQYPEVRSATRAQAAAVALSALRSAASSESSV